MKQVFRKIIAFVYQKIVKPVLFRFPPDDVHDQMIRTGTFTQRLPVLGKIMSAMMSHRDDRLRQNVFGLDFINPIGLSAGMDKNAALPPTMKSIGFGFATVGSITAKPSPGNPKPWYHRLPNTKSIVVNAGLPNHGVEKLSKHIAAFDGKIFQDFRLVASIAKTNSPESVTDKQGAEDYVAGFVGLIENPNVAMFELNISCPNTYGGEPFTRTLPLDDLLTRLDDLKLTKPLVVKMPIDKPWEEFKALLDVIVKHNVQGVTIGNLQKDRTKISAKDELPETIPGNLSGRACFDDSNNLIKKTYQTYGDKLTIIGVGGVFSAEDAYLKIKSGATLVEMITGVIFNGPQIVGQINHDLVKLIEADGFGNIAEAIGVDARK